jgi:hypothetical protein
MEFKVKVMSGGVTNVYFLSSHEMDISVHLLDVENGNISLPDGLLLIFLAHRQDFHLCV